MYYIIPITLHYITLQWYFETCTVLINTDTFKKDILKFILEIKQLYTSPLYTVIHVLIKGMYAYCSYSLIRVKVSSAC